jgi:hypothetical protein
LFSGGLFLKRCARVVSFFKTFEIRAGFRDAQVSYA